MKTYIVTNYDELQKLYKKQSAAYRKEKIKNRMMHWQDTLKQKSIGLCLFVTACLALLFVEGGLGYSIWAIPLGLYLMFKGKVF